MSSLYKTPEQVIEEYKSRLIGQGGGGANWYTDRVKGGVTRDKEGNIQRSGVTWWLQGLEQEGFAETAADRNRDIQNANTIKNTLGDTPEEEIREALGDRTLTKDNVASIKRKAEKIDREKPTPVQQAAITKSENAHSRAISAQEDATEIARETLGVTRDNNKNQMTLAANQMELSRLDNKFDRETASADRNLTLRLSEMNADLQDKRMAYDRETRSMDKRDRMIATLMSGLGQLGGAFSL